MDLEKTERVNQLFDIYQELLTENQKELVIEYYQDDFSLSEIAENKNISRNAVFSQLKRVIETLEEYEQKLSLLDKRDKIFKVLEDPNLNAKTVEKIKKILD